MSRVAQIVMQDLISSRDLRGRRRFNAGMQRSWIHLLAWGLLACGLSAQVDRYELGLRLRAFERRFEDVVDKELRAAAYAHLDRAVQAFFRLDTKGVARSVDAADCALAGGDCSNAELHARSLQLSLNSRLVAAGDGRVTATLSVAYPIEDEDFEPSSWSIVLGPPFAIDPVSFVYTELPLDISVPLAGVPEGDHQLRWSIVERDELLLQRVQGLSVATDLVARSQNLMLEAKNAKALEPATIESKTLPALANMVRGMQRRRRAETVLPGVQILEEAESLAAWLRAPAGPQFYDANRVGSFRLRVPVGKRTIAVRVSVPAIVKKAPLVLALHGAGGSENLFFDGYGDGRVVALSAERGWVIAAPRLTMGNLDCVALSDALAERFPIDKERVMMVGHSMGAMQAVSNAVRMPHRYRAVAALGGGGRVRPSATLKSLPFFVGVGTEDFARGSAGALNKSLLRAGVTSTLREYLAVEHLAIVQLALPDVFRFFDESLAQ
jgi:predicted esterase